MIATREQIEDLVLRLQSVFLDHPTLALTQPGVERRFGVDDVTCASALGALVDAGVLTEREGVYRRRFPRPGQRVA